MPVPARRLMFGGIVAGSIALLVAALFLSLTLADAGSARPRPVDVWHLLRMTTIQAGLSTLLSLLAGIMLAWSLDRLRFVGRHLLVGLFAAAIVTPGLVVAFGLLGVWGRAGWINSLIAPFGLSTGSIFGLGGIVAAHVVLNGAFASRVLLARMEAVPDVRLRTGRSLGLGAWRRFALIDWPAISGALPGLGAIIFLLCFTSFPVVLMLGGGPANQTLEVAIYAAVRLDFDLSGAVRLALVQLAVSATIILPAAAALPGPALAGVARRLDWPDGPAAQALQVALLLLASIGFALPLLSVLLGSASAGLWAVLTSSSFAAAALTSLWVGSASALLALGLALVLCFARAEARSKPIRLLMGLPAYAYLAIPAVVLALGFFLVTRRLGMPPSAAAPVVLILANALLTLPFAVATLGPATDAIARRYGRLSRALDLGTIARWRHVEWPLLAREIGLVLALGFCFSLGDLGVISLFGTEDFTTLPWMMMRAMGSYRTDTAAIIAAVLLALSLMVFFLLPRLFARWSHADA